MVKRKPKKTELPPYWHNPDISIFYELDFGKDTLVPGTRFKIKGSRGSYIFHKLVHNSKIDKTWVDCMDVVTGEYKSFYVEKIKAVLKNKKSRDKDV